MREVGEEPSRTRGVLGRMVGRRPSSPHRSFWVNQKRHRVVSRLANASGQMTVEFAVMAPVLIMVGFIAMNALVFLGDCAAFDMVAREAVRMQADDGFEGSSGAAEVRQRIEENLFMEHETVSVACERTALGHVRYTASTSFSPPFLKGARVFGVTVPTLEHEISMTVSPLRKGVIV